MEEALPIPRLFAYYDWEILLNDRLNLGPWKNHGDIQSAFRKAYSWYCTYKSLIHSMITRTPLPPQQDNVDFRDYRTFAKDLRVCHNFPN